MRLIEAPPAAGEINDASACDKMLGIGTHLVDEKVLVYRRDLPAGRQASAVDLRSAKRVLRMRAHVSRWPLGSAGSRSGNPSPGR